VHSRNMCSKYGTFYDLPVLFTLSRSTRPQSTAGKNGLVFLQTQSPNFMDGLKLHNSVALVRERTIPTELPPLVGEVSANFCE
jgi:hypothetical protein